MSKIPLSQIVAEFVDSADLSDHYFRRLYNIAVRGAREFNMDIQGQFKSVLLSIEPNQTVPFPKDYLQYSKIGIVNAYGEAVALRHNEDLATLRSAYLAAQGKVVNVPSIGDAYTNPECYPYYWLNWGYTGGLHLYGIGGGTGIIGEFTIDDANRCIFLQSGFPYSSIMLEYLSDGFDCDCNEYMVDTYAAEAMVCYIRWKQAQDLRKKYSVGEVRYFKSEYYRERWLASTRINSVNIPEMQVVFRSSVKLVARA